MTSTTLTLPGGTWTLGDTTVSRFGYGGMQLAGPWVLGPPKDHDAALAVVRHAVESGITHIDTAETYGPRVVNELIREALHPYAKDLFIATKAGGRRDAQGGWPSSRRPDDLRAQINDNLETLGVDVLDLVHLRERLLCLTCARTSPAPPWPCPMPTSRNLTRSPSSPGGQVAAIANPGRDTTVAVCSQTIRCPTTPLRTTRRES